MGVAKTRPGLAKIRRTWSGKEDGGRKKKKLTSKSEAKIVNTTFNFHTKKHGLLKANVPIIILAPDLLLSFQNFATYLAGANFVQVHFSSSAPNVDLTTGQNPRVVITEVSWDPVYIV